MCPAMSRHCWGRPALSYARWVADHADDFS